MLTYDNDAGAALETLSRRLACKKKRSPLLKTCWFFLQLLEVVFAQRPRISVL